MKNNQGGSVISTLSITKTKTALVAFVMVLILMMLSACGGGNKSTENGSNAANQEGIVELQAIFPGDTPADFDKVIEAVNNKMKADGIGASLNIKFLPWNDYGNTTTLKTTAGEEFDMFLDAPWLHINQMIASNAIIPLDDYVNKAPELQKSIPQQMWDANKYNGKTYGIPLGISQGKVGGFLIRKDLREKYGLQPIKSMQDLETFLYKVKENEKEVVPFGTDGRYADGLLSYFNPENYKSDNPVYEVGVDVLFNGTKDGKIIPIYERPGFEDTAKKMSQYYKDGILEKNIAQQENATALFNQGKIAAIGYSGDGVEGLKYTDALKVKGVQLEVAIMNEDRRLTSDFKQWNFLCVPTNSKHPDKVMDVMNWLSIKENHDLLEYGIEGTHWTAVGEDEYKVVEGSQYSFPGYTMTWRPTLVRTPDHMLASDKKWFDFTRDANNFDVSPYSGFTPNTEVLKTEIAKLSPIKSEILNPLGAGILNASKGLPMLKERYESSGAAKVIAELQKQVDAFKATK